eukprot:XP_014042040.1 PREDICTED: uncharacterized protein LOC106595186 [Salmo salar]
MTLIVDQLKKDFSEMDNTIKDKRTALQIAVNDDVIFNELMRTNQALPDKLSTEIKELKIKKFNQDKKDKAEDKVYFWRNPDRGGPAPPLHVRRRRDDTYFDPPPSDQHSTTSASSASSGRFLFNERLGRRKGAGGRRHAHRRDAAPDGGAVITPAMDLSLPMQPSSMMAPITHQMNHMSLGNTGTVSPSDCNPAVSSLPHQVSLVFLINLTP